MCVLFGSCVRRGGVLEDRLTFRDFQDCVLAVSWNGEALQGLSGDRETFHDYDVLAPLMLFGRLKSFRFGRFEFGLGSKLNEIAISER